MDSGVQVKESSGGVVIFGLAMQATATHLRDRLRQSGAPATIGLLPGVPGYQLIVHNLALADVLNLLKQFGVDVKNDAPAAD